MKCYTYTGVHAHPPMPHPIIYVIYLRVCESNLFWDRPPYIMRVYRYRYACYSNYVVRKISCDLHYRSMKV